MLERVAGWEVPIGVTYKEFVAHDFEKMQMLVVAGMTRYGKTVFLKNAITTLINNRPDNVKFTLIDLKGGLAFSRFATCKQVNKVAKNGAETLEALEAIHAEMEQRQALFLSNGWEDIGEAGWKDRHFIVVDEGAEIAGFEDKADRDRCTHLLGEIARIGAGLGYRMIFATQYPVADVFPRQVKANTSAALCFKLKNSTQSIVVLDRKGAEELPVGLRGRAIYQTDCDRIVQTPLITNEFIDIKIKPHVNIRARKEDASASQRSKAEEARGKYTTEFEET
nr:FtsK/SpoIIIE domain-containing protein [Bacillus sp. ISL-37]